MFFSCTFSHPPLFPHLLEVSFFSVVGGGGGGVPSVPLPSTFSWEESVCDGNIGADVRDGGSPSFVVVVRSSIPTYLL